MTVSLEHVLAQIQRWTSPRLDEHSDALLLERFVQHRDELAFAALVSRHGGMVLRSCRRVLGDAHAAEDAFQAVFLILARKAHTLRRPAELPGWLHGVARRVAFKARTKSVGRAAEVPLPEELPDTSNDPLTCLTARELLTVLDEEIARLPTAQRSAVVLCCLEGHTQEEAARMLGWTAGSLKGHLERGRRRLHASLQRRSITLSAALALVAVSRGEATSMLLLQNTVKALLGGGGSAAALAHSVLKTMLLTKLAGVVAVTLTIALAASTTVALVYRGSTAEAPEDKTPAVPTASKDADTGKPQVRTDVWGDPLPSQAVARLGAIRFYHGDNQWVHCVTLSPDGKWVASTARDGNRLWDAATGREQPLRKELQLRNAAIFATRDKLIAIEERGLEIQFWDVVADKRIGVCFSAFKTGSLTELLHRGSPGGHSSLELSPDGRTLVIEHDSEILFCDIISGQVEKRKLDRQRRGNTKETRLALSADSKTLVLQDIHPASRDTTIHVWDAVRRTETTVSRTSKDYDGPIAVSPDGTILAIASSFGKRIRLWDTRTLKELPPLLKQPKKVTETMAFSPDGKQLVSNTPDNGPTLYLWDLSTRKTVRQLQGEFKLWTAVFSADGKYLAAGDGERVVFWDLATGNFRHDFGHRYMIDSVCFCPDGGKLASGAGFTDNLVRIWAPLTGNKTAQLAGHKEGIEVVAYAPDGKLIASGSQDKTIRLWDAATNQEVRRLEAKDSMVYAMAFAPDGRTIASGGNRKAVHLWDVATGRELRSFDNPGSWIVRLAFSPDGKLLATRGFKEKAIRIWDVAKGQQIRQLAGPAAGCPSLAFSPDGRMLAAGGDDAVVHFWDVLSGEKIRILTAPLQPGGSNRVLSIAFSPDGHSLAAGYDDGIVRLRELVSGCERLRFEGHFRYIMSLAFSPDSTLLASGGGNDRVIMVWDVTGQRTTHPPRNSRLRVGEGNAIWGDLADPDARKAYRAMQTLLAAGEQTAPLLKQRLRPAVAIDVRRVDRLIADLDSDRFEVRETAERDLRKFGDDAEPALRKQLASKPSAEQRLRVKKLLQDIDSARSSERLRGVRAVEVLERLGTAEA